MLPDQGSVALDLELDVAGDQKERVREHLTRRLSVARVSIKPKSTVKVVARLKKGKAHKQKLADVGVSIHFADSQDGIKNRSVTEVKSADCSYELSVVWDEEVRWTQIYQTKLGSSIHVNAGETIQQAVDRAMEPKVDFFLNAYIPSRKAQLENGEIGKSFLSRQGIR